MLHARKVLSTLSAIALAISLPAQEQGSANTRQVLESVQAATQGNELDIVSQLEANYATTSAAAAAFANQVSAGDTAKFVELYGNSFQIANEAELRELAPNAIDLSDDFAMPLLGKLGAQSIYVDDTYLENYRTLIQSGRIVGATRRASEFADCVAVGGEFNWCCTGTLIAPNVVLSAGHCDEGACSCNVFIGEDVNTPGQIIPVKERFRHSDYNGSTLANDLVVLVLERDVEGVTPRPIASSEMIDAAILMRAVGYGNTDLGGSFGFGKRLLVDLPIVSSSCHNDGTHRLYGCHPDREIVAGRKGLRRDTCRGDSGGPLLVEHNDTWWLAGATSRATDVSTVVCGDGGIYVRIDQYLDWINDVTGLTLLAGR